MLLTIEQALALTVVLCLFTMEGQIHMRFPIKHHLWYAYCLRDFPLDKGIHDSEKNFLVSMHILSDKVVQYCNHGYLSKGTLQLNAIVHVSPRSQLTPWL